MGSNNKIQAKRSSEFPTVSTRFVLISININTMKNKDVAIAYIPSAFLDTDMDKGFYMILKVPMTRLMETISSSTYCKYLFII